MRSQRAIIAIVASTAWASVLASSAVAGDIPEPDSPAMSTTVSHTTTTTTICGDGALRVGGATLPTWTMTTVGGRDDGTRFTDAFTASGPTFHHCYTAQKGGTSTGGITATLTYFGAGFDLPSIIVGYGTWELGRDDEFEMRH